MRSVAKRLKPRVREHNLTLVAAGVAFYAFLALVPALVAFMSVYGLVANPDDVTRQVQDIASALPKEVQDFLVFQLTSIANANRAGVSVTLIVAVAAGPVERLGRHGRADHRHPRRPRARGAEELRGTKRGKALLLTIGAMVFLGIVIFVVAVLPPLLSKAGLGTAGPHPVRHPALADPGRGHDRRASGCSTGWP